MRKLEGILARFVKRQTEGRLLVGRLCSFLDVVDVVVADVGAKVEPRVYSACAIRARQAPSVWVDTVVSGLKRS